MSNYVSEGRAIIYTIYGTDLEIIPSLTALVRPALQSDNLFILFLFFARKLQVIYYWLSDEKFHIFYVGMLDA